MEVVAAEVNRGRCEQDDVVGDGPGEPGELRGHRFPVAEVVGLVHDTHVDQWVGLFPILQEPRQFGGRSAVGGPSPCPSGPEALEARDDREARGFVARGLAKPVQCSPRIKNLCFDAESVLQFALPLLAQHRGTQDEQASKVVSRTKLGPD